STGTAQISLSGTEVLRDRWFAGLIDYCDSVKAVTGWLPDLHGISFAKRSGLSIYHNRYFDPHVNAGGDTVWRERYTAPLPKRSGSSVPVQTQGATKTAPVVTLAGLAPNPVTSENIELSLIVSMEIHARLELV